jgi:pyruvate dehydrogenase E2 component (dihydrolipoamide acetyltransferase)
MRDRPRAREVTPPTETDLGTRPVEPAADRAISVGASGEVARPVSPQPPGEDTMAGGKEPATEGGDQRRQMSRLRRTIAANMSRSWAEIPHVTTFDDVDATRMLDVRQALGARHGVKIPIEALVVKAVIPVLRAFPDFNSSIDGDELVVHGAHDIGIAVDTPDGLLVAVIRDAASRSVLDLATEVRRLGEGGKERSLSPDELGGQTFTVSNIGALGGGHGTPLVPHGTTAILSVGMAKDKPVARDGSVVVAPVMPLSLSYDHRVIDGGLGRRFMALLIENLEEPALFLAE